MLGGDLADMTEELAEHNKGQRYILVLMDLFSRKVSLIPLKNKKGKTIARALDEFLAGSPDTYTHYWADEGGEFVNNHTQKIYEKYNIIRYNIYNRRFKNSLVERFIRALKPFPTNTLPITILTLT